MMDVLTSQMQRLVAYFKQLPIVELLRYAIVGFTLNLIGYLIYLLVTALWLSPVTTIAIFYPISVLIGYFAHRRHTFQQRERNFEGIKLFKYFVAYGFGYLLNILILLYFNGQLGIPHQLVQIAAIFIVALFLFVSMKFYVFKNSNS